MYLNFLIAEAGHALVGSLMPEYDLVAKISIIPRGQAGGLTFFAPSEERLESGLYSRSYLENQMAVALGGRCGFCGNCIYLFMHPLVTAIFHSDALCANMYNHFCRVAEEVIFGQDNVTTRASSDFMHVSRVARQMVERFGLMYPFW